MSVANPYNKGGKAQSLQRLSEAGFRVPPFFLCDSTWSREDILNKIKSDLRKSNFFAVRSSAEGEDSAQKSFAGHFYSAVAIKKGQVYDEVKKVCASFKGLTGSVIIQEFIASDSAGVMFSEVEGGKVVINSTLGMCFPVVNGQACDEYICHKNGRIVSKTVQDKSAAFFREGVISTENTKKESLNSEEISELTDLAQRIQKLFRSPQDIEWCFKENKLYVLQSRPITRSFKIGEEEYFDSANIAESYSGIVLPLTCTFARMVYERVYKDLLAMSGVSRKKIERYSMIFENLLGFFYGRMYYNMNNWYHLAEFVPGYERNKKNFEGMITSNIREEVQKAIKPSLGLTVAYPFIVALKLLTYGFATRLFKWRVNKYLRELRQKDFGSLSYAECIKLFHKINEKLLNKWYVTLENDFFVMTYLGLLKKLLKEEDIQKAIVFESKATEQVKAIADLSAKIYEDQSLWASVQSRNINDFQVKIKGRLDMNTSLQEYLSSFGGRFANELKLESIGVDEDVGKLLDVLKAYHDHQPRAALKPQKLNISFARNTIVQLILWKFRKYASRREEFRLLRSNTFGLARKLFRQMGSLLYGEGSLEDKDHIFYLNLDEVLHPTQVDQTLKEIVVKRKKQYSTYSEVRPPSHFVTLNRTPPLIPNTHSLQSDLIQAKPASSGKIRGRVKIFKDFFLPSKIDFEIMVTSHTDPGWTPLIALSKGLIIEHGGVLSHASIVARELGIPTVIGALGATTTFRDGQVVEIDGSNGMIKLLI